MAKPLNKPAAPLLPRERIWAAIRMAGAFTVRDLTRKIARAGRFAAPPLRALDDTSVRNYCQRLQRAGILEHDGHQDSEPVWQLVRDAGVEAPHLTLAGDPVTDGRWMEQAWRAMRIARSDWTIAQLTELASTPEHPARKAAVHTYVTYLAAAGYLQIVQEASRKEPARLRLKPGAWTGPRPPKVVKLSAVFDRNTGATVMLDDPAEVADEA